MPYPQRIVSIMLLFFFCGCGGKQNRIKPFSFKSNVYKIHPYSETLFDQKNTNKERYYMTEGYIETTAQTTPVLWNGLALSSLSPSQSPNLLRAFYRTTGQHKAPARSDFTCDEADVLMATVSKILRLPIDRVSIVGDFSPEGFLVCDDFDKAFNERITNGATHVFGPKEQTVANGVHYRKVSTFEEAVEILGGPKPLPVISSQQFVQSLNELDKTTVTKNHALKETLKSHLPALVEISNGAGVDDQTRANSRAAISHAKEARIKEQKHYSFSALLYLTLADSYAKKATGNTKSSMPNSTKRPIGILQTVSYLVSKNLVPKTLLNDTSIYESDHVFTKTKDSKSALSKWFEPYSKNNVSKESAQSKQRAKLAIIKTINITGHAPKIPLLLWATADQMSPSEMNDMQWHRTAQLLSEFYTFHWLADKGKDNQ